MPLSPVLARTITALLTPPSHVSIWEYCLLVALQRQPEALSPSQHLFVQGLAAQHLDASYTRELDGQQALWGED